MPEDTIVVAYWVWDDRLLTGIESIDEQHRRLFSETNNLLRAVKEHRPYDVLQQYLQFLGLYITKHFSEEEGLMHEHGYPDLFVHRKDHIKFVTDYQRNVDALLSNPISTVALIPLVAGMQNWLYHHIMRHDKDLAAWIKAQAGANG